MASAAKAYNGASNPTTRSRKRVPSVHGRHCNPKRITFTMASAPEPAGVSPGSPSNFARRAYQARTRNTSRCTMASAPEPAGVSPGSPSNFARRAYQARTRTHHDAPWPARLSRRALAPVPHPILPAGHTRHEPETCYVSAQPLAPRHKTESCATVT